MMQSILYNNKYNHEYNPEEMRRSALHEVGNIGASHAMTALSTMLNQRVEMSVPTTGIVALTEFVQMTGGMESVAVGVYMPVSGDAPGHVAFLWPEGCAYRLADQLLGRGRGETTDFGELECSALMETGNILASSYLTAMSNMTGLTLRASPPAIAVDMSAALLGAIAAEFASLEEEALTILTRVSHTSEVIDGYFIYIPESGSLPAILRALQVEC